MDISVVKCLEHEARVYHVKKNAPTCVCLFGALQDIETTIDTFTDVLVEHYNYLTIEAPGFGLTDPLPPNYSFEYIAECLNSILLKHVGNEPVRIIACSYGTALAVEFARLYPERVTQLVLAGSVIDISETHWPTLFSIMNKAYVEQSQFVEGFIDLMMSPDINPKRFSGIKKAAIRKARKYSDKHFMSFVYNTIRLMSHNMGDLSSIKSPVLVTTGEHDPFGTVDEAIKLSQRFLNGRFVPLLDCDHLFHIEDPKQLITTVMLFFTRYEFKRRSENAIPFQDTLQEHKERSA